MDADDFWEIRKKIGQSSEAMAAHILNGDEDLAREVAEGLTHEQLITLVLWLERLYAFGNVQAIQQASGMESEEAKAVVAHQLRMRAAAESLQSDNPEQWRVDGE
jgi:uncharacterized protein YoaH (UPF0181 family)